MSVESVSQNLTWLILFEDFSGISSIVALVSAFSGYPGKDDRKGILLFMVDEMRSPKIENVPQPHVNAHFCKYLQFSL